MSWIYTYTSDVDVSAAFCKGMPVAAIAELQDLVEERHSLLIDLYESLTR